MSVLRTLTAVKRLQAGGLKTADLEAEAVTVGADKLGVSKSYLDLKLTELRMALDKSIAEESQQARDHVSKVVALQLAGTSIGLLYLLTGEISVLEYTTGNCELSRALRRERNQKRNQEA